MTVNLTLISYPAKQGYYFLLMLLISCQGNFFFFDMSSPLLCSYLKYFSSKGPEECALNWNTAITFGIHTYTILIMPEKVAGI